MKNFFTVSCLCNMELNCPTSVVCFCTYSETEGEHVTFLVYSNEFNLNGIPPPPTFLIYAYLAGTNSKIFV
jgi:hypothetical protein